MLDRKQLYKFLAESIGEKVVADNDEDIISQADRAIRMEAVDFGLTSGTLWAKCNLGAEYEWDFGGLFGWGMTEPYRTTQTTDDYKTIVGVEIRGNLQGETDAASVWLGDGWRIPTKEEVEELISRTYSCVGEMKGVKGRFVFKAKSPLHRGKKDIYKFSSLYDRDNDVYIFLPFCGVLSYKGFLHQRSGKSGSYRCSTQSHGRLTKDNFVITEKNFDTTWCYDYSGYSIRPVRTRK